MSVFEYALLVSFRTTLGCSRTLFCVWRSSIEECRYEACYGRACARYITSSDLFAVMLTFHFFTSVHVHVYPCAGFYESTEGQLSIVSTLMKGDRLYLQLPAVIANANPYPASIKVAGTGTSIRGVDN